MKKTIAILLAAVTLLGLAACAGDAPAQDAAPETKAQTVTQTATEPEIEAGPMQGGLVQIANPFVDYDTLEEAAKQTGFALTVPEVVEGYAERTIQVMDNTMLQVIYWNGDSRLFVRKAAGSEDISGDYNTYDDVQTVTVGDREVSLQGSGGTYSLAAWVADGYTYAVMADEPLTAEALTALISGIG